MMHGGKKLRSFLQAFFIASFCVSLFGVHSFINSGNAAIIVPSIPNGQIVGRCVGWPNPRVEIEWSPYSPPGTSPPNSNSIERMKAGAGWTWFYAGGYPGVNGKRINGSSALAWNPAYPYPNYTVHDLRDAGVQIGTTYTYRVKYRPALPSANSYTVTIDAASCGATPTPTTSVTATPTPTTTVSATPPPDAGRIDGVCLWNNGAPEIHLSWSEYPPPGTGAANSNSIEKGDSYPSDPLRYWEFLSNSPTQYTYIDRAVSLNTQYQYRVKYRPAVTSINTYNVYVSVATCGGPTPTQVPLSVRPSFQTVPPNVTAFLEAEGGDGTYTWSAPGGTLSNTEGPQIGVVYTNDTTDPVDHIVTVFSGGQSATAIVTVDGLETFQDSIELTGLGNRFLLINDDAPVTRDPDVQLTLAHGFIQEASTSIVVQPSNSVDDVLLAPTQPFEKYTPWNLCGDSPGCSEGFYTVYGIYTAPSGTKSPIVLDSITYLIDGEEGQPYILINNGAEETTERSVALTLWHGFKDVPRGEISMQLANLPGLVDAATPVFYSSFVDGWDLCNGVGSRCANGLRTVYAKFCARGVCQNVVFDDINFNSLWPDWGVEINNDAPTTDTSKVQLGLNPWFDVPGTTVLISNLVDLSDAVSGSFSDIIPWDLCYNRIGLCDTSAPLPVYVRYINNDQPTWPGPRSPRYQDDILLTEEPVIGPAAILINGDEPTTTSRYVRLDFTSPFGGGPGVEMRPINEKALNARDIGLLQTEFNGGIASQVADISSSATGNVVVSVAPGTASTSAQFSELESAPARTFTPNITAWDLCGGAVECPYGTYRVLVQYYKRLSPQAGSETGSQTFAALGDQISTVYYDLIDYIAQTPTPTPSATVSPTPSVTASVTVSPSTTPTTSASPTPTTTIGASISPTPSTTSTPVVLPPWLPPVLENAEPVIGPLAVASAVAVAATAVIALIPIAGPGLIAFAWQSFLGALGLLPKRKKTWGTVYDSNTKRPIPYAKVQLLDRNRRVLETRIADKEGRYGFLTTPESLQAQNIQIYLQPSAPEYNFPSHVQPTVDTFVYNNLYYGDLITVNDKSLINFDIPLDPLKPSAAPLLIKSPSIALGASVAALADAGFWIGLIMVPLSFLLTPNPFTFGVMCLFLGTASLRFFGIQEQPFGVIEDAQTGRPMPFALITLADASGRRVGFAVSDEQGRYFIVAEKGMHQLTVHTPATVQPPRHYQQAIDVKKGWITRTIRL